MVWCTKSVSVKVFGIIPFVQSRPMCTGCVCNTRRRPEHAPRASFALNLKYCSIRMHHYTLTTDLFIFCLCQVGEPQICHQFSLISAARKQTKNALAKSLIYVLEVPKACQIKTSQFKNLRNKIAISSETITNGRRHDDIFLIIGRRNIINIANDNFVEILLK